jgi:hypothetical protein
MQGGIICNNALKTILYIQYWNRIQCIWCVELQFPILFA